MPVVAAKMVDLTTGDASGQPAEVGLGGNPLNDGAS